MTSKNNMQQKNIYIAVIMQPSLILHFDIIYQEGLQGSRISAMGQDSWMHPLMILKYSCHFIHTM